MTQLSKQKDVQGFPSEAIDFSGLIYSASLADAAAVGITVPSTAKNWFVRITVETGAICWVSVNATAAVPVAATFGAITSELINPFKGYEVKVQAADTISVYNASGAVAEASISLYVVENA